jgi:hypothetical protein
VGLKSLQASAGLEGIPVPQTTNLGLLQCTDDPSGQINETPTNDLNRAMAKGTEPTLAWPQ